MRRREQSRGLPMTWKQIKYALLVIIVFLVAALGAWKYYNFSSLKHSDALWRIISKECVSHQFQRKNLLSCSEVNTSAGYVVLKDLIGPLQFLLMPIEKISGIESPRLLSISTPNFFYLAWQARHYLSNRHGQAIDDRFLSLTINSAYGRTQNQLHIHISCLRPDIREQLDKDADSISSTDWKPLAQPVLGHEYLAKRISAATLVAQSPFLLLAREVPKASEKMGEYGMALTPLPDGSLVVLVSHRSLLERNTGSIEEIQDHSCLILKGN